MFETLEKLMRRAANSVGIDIHRFDSTRSLHGRLTSMLKSNGVTLVLDVGANTGQFARSVRRAGYTGQIVSFEPLHQEHAALSRQTSSDDRWIAAPRMAIGQEPGTAEIYVSSNSFSSSLLEVLPQHIRAAPASVTQSRQEIEIATLDSAARQYIADNDNVFIKIDTQGYEDRVLSGAPLVLDRASGVHVELSLVPLYQDQELFGVLTGRLQSLGFEIWAIWPGIHDPQSGRMLQVDVTFFRQ